MRVKASIDRPRHAWAGVSHASIGTYIEQDDDGDCRVNFPESSRWCCIASEIELGIVVL